MKFYKVVDSVVNELAAIVLAFFLGHYLVTSVLPEYALW